MPFKYTNLQERILANTVSAPNTWFNGSPCWWWIGATQGFYAKMSVRSTRVKNDKRKIKSKLVHREVRKIFKGEVYRRGQYSRHLCPPHPNRMICCNYDHVAPGSPRQNNRQTVAEGRHRNGRGTS